MSLCGSRSALFPAAEKLTYDEFKSIRGEGARVSGQMMRILMKKHVGAVYGSNIVEKFKASKRWLAAFARRWSLSLRRKSNAKSFSAEERRPKLTRWHARLRRRLKRGMQRGSSTAAPSRNLRGGKFSALVSSQGPHRETSSAPPWKLDCGLCAAKNVAVNSALALRGLLVVVRPLQAAKAPGCSQETAILCVAITGMFAGGTAMFEAGILVFWPASLVLYAAPPSSRPLSPCPCSAAVPKGPAFSL